jgi:hypothetical protein
MALVSFLIVVPLAHMAVAIFASTSVVASFLAWKLLLVWRAVLELWYPTDSVSSCSSISSASSSVMTV